MANCEKTADIHIESWSKPGELNIIDGSNGQAEIFSASFSSGLDQKLKELALTELRVYYQSLKDHYLQLLENQLVVGPRRLRLCQITLEELEQLINWKLTERR